MLRKHLPDRPAFKLEPDNVVIPGKFNYPPTQDLTVTELHITYDPAADTLYIRSKDDEVADSVEVGGGITVDYNAKGEVIGLEILNFSKRKISLNDVVVKGIEVVIPRLQGVE